MLVGERMSHPVIWITPDLPIHEALNLFKREHISRAPVIKNNKLVGIISDSDLLNASPSAVTSLSIWEMNYLMAKITVAEVMTKKVITINEDTPIEEAARVMSDNNIGGLPVMKDGRVVGIITENDLFKIFLEFMGAREQGIRVSALMPEIQGQLAKLTGTLSALGGNFISFGVFTGEDPSNRMVTFKIAGLKMDEVERAIKPLVISIKDIR
jgi:acetoin utilization protein AcuB